MKVFGFKIQTFKVDGERFILIFRPRHEYTLQISIKGVGIYDSTGTSIFA